MKITLTNKAVCEDYTKEERASLIRASSYPMIETKMFNGSLQKAPTTEYLFKEIGGGLSVPLGALSYVDLKGAEIIDERCMRPFTYHPQPIDLWSHQKKVLDKVKDKSLGVVVCPTGGGKTLIALETIVQKGQKAIIIVDKSNLAKQWIKIVGEHLGLDAGYIAEGNVTESSVTVALIQTLATRENLRELLAGYGTAIFDECHHVPADLMTKVALKVPCKYRFGFSATPERLDGSEKAIYLLLGPLIHEVTRKELIEAKVIVPVHIQIGMVEEDVPRFTNESATKARHAYINWLVKSKDRNRFILSLTDKTGYSPHLILTERKEHVEELSMLAEDMGIKHTALHGGMPKKAQREGLSNPEYVTIATSSLIGEGIDVKKWRQLTLATPISSKTRLLQAIGRICRADGKKHTAVVYDLIDNTPLAWSALKKRKKIYEEEGFPFKHI